MLGLEGHEPETVDPDAIPDLLARMRRRDRLDLAGRAIPFSERDHIVSTEGSASRVTPTQCGSPRSTARAASS